MTSLQTVSSNQINICSGQCLHRPRSLSLTVDNVGLNVGHNHRECCLGLDPLQAGPSPSDKKPLVQRFYRLAFLLLSQLQENRGVDVIYVALVRCPHKL